MPKSPEYPFKERLVVHLRFASFCCHYSMYEDVLSCSRVHCYVAPHTCFGFMELADTNASVQCKELVRFSMLLMGIRMGRAGLAPCEDAAHTLAVRRFSGKPEPVQCSTLKLLTASHTQCSSHVTFRGHHRGFHCRRGAVRNYAVRDPHK